MTELTIWLDGVSAMANSFINYYALSIQSRWVAMDSDRLTLFFSHLN